MAFFRRKQSNPHTESAEAPATPVADPATVASAARHGETSDATGRRGLFARFREGLKKTTQVLNTDVRDLFKKEGMLLDAEFLDKLFQILIKTDMGVKPATAIRDQIETDFRGRVVRMGDILAVIKENLLELTAQPQEPIAQAGSGPTVVMVVGVNGSGKTTSIAKLAKMFTDAGKSVVLGAGDTFRAAAVEQLVIWAERVGVQIVTGEPGSDPAERRSSDGGQSLGTARGCVHYRYGWQVANAGQPHGAIGQNPPRDRQADSRCSA